MKILITGGMGFIGSNFIRYMLDKYPDYKLVNLDKLTYAGNPDNLKDIENNTNYKFIKGDICDRATVEKAMEGCNAVINFAAESHVDRSIEDAGDFAKTNFYGAYIMMDVAKEKKVDRFIQISTDEVYGSIQEGKFKETDAMKPNSPYSAAKAGADLLARAYYVTFGLPTLVTRSSNNFGPYQFPEKFIPLFVTNAIEDKPLPLYGDGLNVRDWIFVEDNCKGIDIVLHKGKLGEAYNIGGNCEKQNIEIAKKIVEVLGKPESLIQPVADRLGHDRRYALDSAKLEALGFKPDENFHELLSKTVNWYKDNPDWWKKLKG